MTLRDNLKQQLAKDYAKAPLKIWNQKNIELKWNDTEKLYTGFDGKGVEWIASIQHTIVPIFSVKCTNLQRKGDAEVECGAISFLPICDDNIIKCRTCNKEFTATLNISKSSQAYKTLQDLDKKIGE